MASRTDRAIALMQTENLTITEAAKRVGVSKQAVSRKLNWKKKGVHVHITYEVIPDDNQVDR